MNHQELEKYSQRHYKDEPTGDSSFDQFYELSGKCRKVEVNLENAWKKVEKQLHTNKDSQKNQVSWLRYAAAVVLLAIASVALWTAFDAAEVTTVVAKQEILVHKLPDGTMVTLREESSISYTQEYGLDSRAVKLEGQGYFDVVSSDAPFRISTEHGDVSVLGTVFDIETAPRRMFVLVEEGRVKAVIEDQEVILSAKQSLSYHKDSKKIAIDRSADLNRLFWVSGNLTFDNASMTEVVATLSKSFDVAFRFGDQDIENCRLTGNFSNNDLDEILEKITTVLELKYDRKGDIITLKGRGC